MANIRENKKNGKVISFRFTVCKVCPVQSDDACQRYDYP